MDRKRIFSSLLLVACLVTSPVLAQVGNSGDEGPGSVAQGSVAQGPGGRGPGGRGFGPGRGLGPGGAGRHGAADERHQADHEVFQFLLQNHEKITRTVKELPNGVETLTVSDDVEVADKIKEHVHWMEVRIVNTQPIRMRDPLFAELFRHTDKIVMQVTETDNGVRVVETSSDPYVVKLIQAHGRVVSGFVDRGFAEAMKNHPVPEREPSEAAAEPTSKLAEPTSKLAEQIGPAIASYGKVFPLPEAAAQPRDGSKICVDVTGGGDADKLNPAIEKVARYVNLYRGGGKTPAEVRITMVLHGDATLTVLNQDAYAERFGVDQNPNFDCLHELHHAGVEILVCGQSLQSKGARPDQVVVFADVAVSALTAVVNHQMDGYSMTQIR